MKKILCIRFSSIGDIILTTPIVRALKYKYPDAEIHVVTKVQNVQMWNENPYVFAVHAYEGSIWKLANKLRKIGFDAIVDLHKNLRSHLLCALLFKWPYQIDKFTAERKLRVKKKINRIPKKHLVDRNFEALKSLGIENDLKGLDFFIPKNQEINPMDIGVKGKYIVYALGAQHITKVLSYPKMIELCDRLQAQIVLIGDEWDAHYGYRLSTLFPDKVIDYCNKTSIAQSASLMRQAEFVITHDSSMMHIASALKKKIFVIWGSTHIDFGMYPYQTEFVSIANNDLPCRPCTTQGTNYCPLYHFDCMNKISLEPIISAASSL
jgi:heptosyltransferase-2